MTRAAKRRSRTPRSARTSDEREIFEAIADYTYDWESWIGANGELRWVNRAVRTLTGYTQDECLRMHGYPLPIVHPEDRAYMSEVLQGAARNSEGNDLEFRIVRKDGSVRWVAMSWRPIQSRDRRPLGHRISVRDIDARKHLEERLLHAKREADAASRAKAEFLAVASHELRTPIHAIRGYAQLLLTREDQRTDPEYLQTMLHESDELLRVVDGILAYAAYDSHQLRPAQAPFALRAVVAHTVEAFASRAKLKNLTLSVHVDDQVPETVLGDAVRLRQVLGNLLENAVKFTAQGGVDVRVSRAVDAPADHVAFVVSDSGVGIPERGVARLFEPFVQGSSASTRQYGGTGLGLAIVHRLCEQMGGAIRARRRPEGGSVFEAVLPLPAAAAARAVHAPALRDDAPALDRALATRVPLEVLVVDDSRAVRELTLEQLRLLGYAPDSAQDGRAAIQLAERKAYDLVLLDVHMPDMDGVTVAKTLRSLTPPSAPAAKIVALSADVFAEEQALQDGSAFDAFIAKPVSLHALQGFLEGLDTDRRSAPPATEGQRPRAVLEPHVISDLLQHRGRDGRPLLLRASQPLLEQSEGELQELARLLGAGELPAASALAHRLKGDCLLVGAWRAAELAGALSVTADRGLLFRAGELLSELRSALGEAREAVERLQALTLAGPGA